MLAQGVQVFEADEVDEVPTEFNIDALEWQDVHWERSNDPTWSRRGSEFVLHAIAVGVRYQVFDPNGDEISAGWRPTKRGAKKAAKRQIRSASLRRQRDRERSSRDEVTDT